MEGLLFRGRWIMGRIVKRIFALAVALSLLSAFLPSCGKKEKYTEYFFDYFDTVTTVVGYAESKAEFDTVCQKIETELERYHKLFDIYNKYEGINNIASLNEVTDGSHPKLEVDSEITGLLQFCIELYHKTEGKTNVAMGSVLKIWHTYRERGLDDPGNAELPDKDELEKAAKHTDINDVIIDGDTVHIKDPLQTLDVGAVAKGYAARRICEKLREAGVDGYVVSIGGSVSCIGDADGKPWRVGIENPRPESEDEYALMLEASDVSVVTSGSYQRYYTVGGKNYHHIIDSETLMPPESFLSVSVICDDPALGDALSTALFCMTHEKGLDLAETTDGVEVIWITRDGEMLLSDGAGKYVA